MVHASLSSPHRCPPLSHCSPPKLLQGRWPGKEDLLPHKHLPTGRGGGSMEMIALGICSSCLLALTGAMTAALPAARQSPPGRLPTSQCPKLDLSLTLAALHPLHTAHQGPEWSHTGGWVGCSSPNPGQASQAAHKWRQVTGPHPGCPSLPSGFPFRAECPKSSTGVGVG